MLPSALVSHVLFESASSLFHGVLRRLHLARWEDLRYTVHHNGRVGWQRRLRSQWRSDHFGGGLSCGWCCLSRRFCHAGRIEARAAEAEAGDERLALRKLGRRLREVHEELAQYDALVNRCRARTKCCNHCLWCSLVVATHIRGMLFKTQCWVTFHLQPRGCSMTAASVC